MAPPIVGNHVDFDPFTEKIEAKKWQRTTLLPGESLYIPKGWWHSVYSTSGTVGISIDLRPRDDFECKSVLEEVTVAGDDGDEDDDDI
jgi:ribosomal protein L16 Arg81 hydroxylase